jgi:ribosomal protein S12 methylthiotransferase
LIRVPQRYHLVTLGCAKNSVDTDSMASLMEGAGYRVTQRPARADVIVVNTCGFIGPAREESLRTLRELASSKRPGQKLIAAGCLTQRCAELVAREVPGVDGILGTRRWMDILEVVEGLRSGAHPAPLYHLPEQAHAVGKDERGVLRASIQGASAYLKIADGCRRPCAFCAIPLIKGTAVSRPLDTLVAEARVLRDRGVHEIILIAQDTTDYGHDLGLRDGLAHLLEAVVSAVPDLPWLRLMYAYPGAITDRLIEVMAGHPQVLPYIDLPLQHAHPAVLRRMRRPANMEWVHATVAKLRAAMPDVALRSTFIVGYPGESEAEFKELLGFLKTMRFDRVGCFTYSYEAETESGRLADDVPAQVKEERRGSLMELQQGISLQRNQAWVGRTLAVLVEGEGEGLAVGRSFRDAPEVDGVVLIEGDRPANGTIVPVTITGALTYDLVGRIAQGDSPA